MSHLIKQLKVIYLPLKYIFKKGEEKKILTLHPGDKVVKQKEN